MIVTPEELAVLRAQALEEYPAESCGVIVRRGDVRRLVRCRNVQNELHARDPERHPRDARTAYYIDPADLLRLGRMEGDGFSVAVIYHSHVDAGAYFSETDRRNALVGGEPAYPDAIYLVTAVLDGRLDATAGFRWEAERRDFVPVGLDEALPSERAGASGTGHRTS
jgi:proteasome lid subunit RPN8/RPN11